MKLAITGGGIAGLALAAALHKKHKQVDFHLYEAVAEYKDVGAGLAIHMNGIKAMTLLGPEVRKAYFDKASDMGEEEQEMSTEVILAQGENMGELVAELGKAKGRKSISRADLLDGLLALVPKERITFGKRVKAIDQDAQIVTVTFEDGSSITADMLIGSDGIHSPTRRYILGLDHPAIEPKNHDGWQIYRTLTSMEEVRGKVNDRWTRLVPVLLGPRGHVNCLPVNKGMRFSAGVAVRGAKFTQSGEAPALDPALYKDYSEDARQIVDLVAKDPSHGWTPADHDHAPTYFNGRVVMMGDAAHASLPFAGNGAAQALEDAAVLDTLLSHLSSKPSALEVEAMFTAYDEVRRPRSQAVVDLARKFGRIYAYAEGDMHKRPEEMRRFFKEAARFTNNFDLDTQNEEAVKVFKGRLSKVPNGDEVKG